MLAVKGNRNNVWQSGMAACGGGGCVCVCEGLLTSLTLKEGSVVKDLKGWLFLNAANQ